MSDVVVKDRSGFNYKYADITQILAKVTAGMKKYNVSLVPGIQPGTAVVEQKTIVNTKTDKTGKPFDKTTTEMLVKADMTFTWINDDDPNETLVVPWFVTGSQEDPSQAFGSGLTYCTRYFLINFFNIAQPESDVDAYRSRQKEAEASEDRTLAEGIIEQFDTQVKTYLADHPDKAEDIKKFCSRYAKNANYKAIKEPSLAGKLLNDFNEKYLKEEK